MRRREHDSAGFSANSLNSDEFLVLPVRRSLPLEADCACFGVAIMAIMATTAQAVDVALRPFLRSKRPGRAGFGIRVECVFHGLKASRSVLFLLVTEPVFELCFFISLFVLQPLTETHQTFC